ncbi:MAG: sulfotransferase [Gemmatimonadota bacterium]
MIAVLVAAGLVLLFVVLLRAFGLVDHSREVIALSRTSLGVIQDPSLADEEKERTLQANTIRIFREFLVLAGGGALALAIPFALAWAGDAVGLVPLDDVVDVSLSPAFLGVSGLLALVALFVPSRGTDAAPGAVDGDDDAGNAAYSGGDRAVHRMAFRTREAQVAVAGLEDRIFRKRLERCAVHRPVFITGLPRAGTTLLLEILAARPEFAAHRYRDMPFLLTPLLWDRLSGSHRQGGALRERTHGDGMLIGPDSPEALEEVVWLAFERPRYEGDVIQPWEEALDPELAAFLRSHLRKIILLRGGEHDPGVRYVSKNNLNIARTRALRRVFTDADVVVPFREPTRHAASLLRQHRNFTEIHQRDAFAREYMREIGHFDFGENLRPVDFDGWYETRESSDPDSLAFWIEYWVAAYGYLLERDVDLSFFSYDALLERPRPSLEALADAIGYSDSQGLAKAGDRLRAPGTTEPDLSAVPDPLLARAREIHDRLRTKAVT